MELIWPSSKELPAIEQLNNIVDNGFVGRKKYVLWEMIFFTMNQLFSKLPRRNVISIEEFYFSKNNCMHKYIIIYISQLIVN